MTPLRQRMLDDMQLRNFCPETQRNYVYHMAGLARFYRTSPESLNLEAVSYTHLLLFSYTFNPSQEMMREVSGGLLWIVFAFAGTLTLNRSFARELPNDCLDALIAAPIPGSALFLGKCFASFVLVLAVELVSLPVFGIFYNVHWTTELPSLLMVLDVYKRQLCVSVV